MSTFNRNLWRAPLRGRAGSLVLGQLDRALGLVLGGGNRRHSGVT